ncbi:MAG: CHASE2 domain-containing protein, partial [Planctomycetes bacterium]|nr:CHASE2 domain-containing protein [Planctomycetota bacterium]
MQTNSKTGTKTILELQKKNTGIQNFLQKLIKSIIREIKYKINIWTIGITLILVLFSLSIALWQPFPGLEEWTRDYRQQSRLSGMNNLIYPRSALSKFKNKLPTPHSDKFVNCFDVCIIAQDETSIHMLDGTPFSPEEYGQIIYMLQEFGVDVIVFDKLFFEERQKHFPLGNSNMHNAIRRAKKTGINTVVGWKYEINPDSTDSKMIPFGPTKEIREITKRGFINVVLSPTDKAVRKYSIVHSDGASLAFSAYLSVFNPEYVDAKTAIEQIIAKKEKFPENYIIKSQLTVDAESGISVPRTLEFYGKPGTIPTISFYDLIHAFNLLFPEYAKCEKYDEKFLKFKEILDAGISGELRELLAEREEYIHEISLLEESQKTATGDELRKIQENIKTYREDFLSEVDAAIAEIKAQKPTDSADTISQIDKSRWTTEDKAFFDNLQNSLARKVAIIGPWTLDSQDLYNVPITSASNAEARMYGVEIHATMIQNLFEVMNSNDPDVINGFTYPTNREIITIIVAVVLFAAFLTIFLTPLWSAALIILSAIIYWFATSYAFVYSTHFYPVVYPIFAFLSTFIFMTVTKFFATDKQRKQIDGMFKNYVDRRFVELLKRDPSMIKLGGERKEISVFFSDIAGFSTFSESMQPEEIVDVLNKYLGAMTEIILEYDGTLDKYIGDAVMAFWNAPMNLPDHATRACISAIIQRKRLLILQREWVEQGYPEIDCRMGINTGQIVHANMGSSLRKNYTLIGDPVNLAARFEPLNKDFGTNIIIGERTYELAKEQIVVRPLGKVQVKGRSEP